MLMRTSEQKQTVSRVHQNVAQWHYGLAREAWDEYNHCLDDKGLFHPDFLPVVKRSLSDYRWHTQIADRLMRILH